MRRPSLLSDSRKVWRCGAWLLANPNPQISKPEDAGLGLRSRRRSLLVLSGSRFRNLGISGNLSTPVGFADLGPARMAEALPECLLRGSLRLLFRHRCPQMIQSKAPPRIATFTRPSHQRLIFRSDAYSTSFVYEFTRSLELFEYVDHPHGPVSVL